MNQKNVETQHDWVLEKALEIYRQPFSDLIHAAQQIHRLAFPENEVQISTLMSIKTGNCPEDCKYCPQSVHYETGTEAHGLLPLEDVVGAAKIAKQAGASRFCMGAAWRNPTDKNLQRVIEMVKAVNDEGMETCVTLGMLNESQAQKLAAAGLDYYNHNLDTSPEYYNEIISTRTYQDRLDTLANVRQSGVKLCCGGIVGMGESDRDRVGLLIQLANLAEHPESVPINMLVRVKGTPMEDIEPLDILEYVRTIALARIMMPNSVVRLSAGRNDMDVAAQALCFLAGANSIFCGDKLLVTPNPSFADDMALLEDVGISAR
ncbi:MAG: biotin synthase BioB [Pseudomonadales bacterium]|nr:biotin synthase BioB [Pseudomonadales bacterium]